VGSVIESWKHSQLYEWLRLKGYVAFNLPLCSVSHSTSSSMVIGAGFASI
jgi:hypothetical protein